MMSWQEYNRQEKTKKYLIRFLSRHRLDQFLDTGIIWFPRSDTFGDKMECVSIDDLKARPFNMGNLENKKQRHLISCWHNATSESIAMWDTAFKKQEEQRVYAIRFKYDDLINYISQKKFNSEIEATINDKSFGRVRYKNLLREKIDQNRMRRVAFRKEYSFHYESEFRFVVQSKVPFHKSGYALEIGNPSELKFSIMVNPLLEHIDYNHHLHYLQSHVIGGQKHADSALVRWLKPAQW